MDAVDTGTRNDDSMNDVTAIILAGGKGTRLKPFTMTIPKPLLPLGDLPIVEVVIRQLADVGIGRIVLTLGHMAPIFTAFLGDGSRWGVQLEYCIEDEPLGTAGPLRLVDDPAETLIVMNGDVLTTLDYGALIQTHRSRGAWGTIALSQRRVEIDYGVVEHDEQGALQAFREKPSIDYSVSMGINLLKREALQYVPSSGRFDMPDLMTTMKEAGRPVSCYPTTCYWQDIGRFDDYTRASEDFAADPQRFLGA